VSEDILAQIDQAVTEYENCPCGREMPEDCPSDYWCSEACQTAWTAHQHDPARYPHPRRIREQHAAEVQVARTRAAEPPAPARSPAVRRPPEPATPLSGLAGWRESDQAIAEMCAYRRWCPRCQVKQPWVIVDDPDAYIEPRPYSVLEYRPQIQECQACPHRWLGRPLVGRVEMYDGPAFRNLIRLRLSDGYRSADRLIPKANLELWRDPPRILEMEWEHLEAMVCDGVTDRQRQEGIARHLTGRHRRGGWDWRALMARVPIISDPNRIRPTDTQ
jgi:hypothetical protein